MQELWSIFYLIFIVHVFKFQFKICHLHNSLKMNTFSSKRKNNISDFWSFGFWMYGHEIIFFVLTVTHFVNVFL